MTNGAPFSSPQTPWEARQPEGEATTVPAFELRPLSLGEILDRTFSLYRARFWLFAGIAMTLAAVQTVGQGISLTLVQHALGTITVRPTPGRQPIPAWANMGWAQIFGGAATVVYLLLTAIVQAAIVWAMVETYGGRSVSVESALRAVWKRSFRWIGIALWQLGSMAWPALVLMIPAFLLLVMGTRTGRPGFQVAGGAIAVLAMLGSLPLGVFFYLRNALGLPAAVAEDLRIRAAIRRSKALSAGGRGRIFVVLLIAACLYEVIGVLQSPAAFLMMLAPHQQHYLATGISLLLLFAGHTLVTPVSAIGLGLLYFDQRVRKEALDLEVLLARARPRGMAEPVFGASAQGHAADR